MKPHLLLLHGALGSETSMEPLKALLEKDAVVHTLSFAGHGNTPASADGMRLASLSQEIIVALEATPADKVWLLGYSMGGYLALYTALLQHKKIAGVITLATKMHWDPSIAAEECKKLNPEIIEQKVPKFAQYLATLHGADSWKPLLRETALFLEELGQTNALGLENLKNISVPCCFTLGEQDTMVTVAETEAAANAMGAAFHLLPNSEHPIEKTNVSALATIVLDFVLQHSQS